MPYLTPSAPAVASTAPSTYAAVNANLSKSVPNGKVDSSAASTAALGAVPANEVSHSKASSAASVIALEAQETDRERQHRNILSKGQNNPNLARHCCDVMINKLKGQQSDVLNLRWLRLTQAEAGHLSIKTKEYKKAHEYFREAFASHEKILQKKVIQNGDDTRYVSVLSKLMDICTVHISAPKI